MAGGAADIACGWVEAVNPNSDRRWFVDSANCLTRIGTTEGKNSWKLRKEAMEEVNTSLSKCGGLIATDANAFSTLKQLFLALRSRLNDSQSNLKPISATLIGLLLNHVDDNAQAKLGKTVYPQIINAATNDMKKTMRDAALAALTIGTQRPKQNGGARTHPLQSALLFAWRLNCLTLLSNPQDFRTCWPF